MGTINRNELVRYYQYLMVFKDKQSGRVLEKRIAIALYPKRLWEAQMDANAWADYRGFDRKKIKIEVSKL